MYPGPTLARSDMFTAAAGHQRMVEYLTDVDCGVALSRRIMCRGQGARQEWRRFARSDPRQYEVIDSNVERNVHMAYTLNTHTKMVPKSVGSGNGSAGSAEPALRLLETEPARQCGSGPDRSHEVSSESVYED